jgi:FeS assembly SUF system protein
LLGKGEEIKKKIIEALRQVYDPEIPINVWDLGLIYELKVNDEGEVYVKMTLTTPGCPIAGIIENQVFDAISEVPGVKTVKVDLVFDPPWTPERITKEGREAFKQVFGYDIVEAWRKQQEAYESSSSGNT